MPAEDYFNIKSGQAVTVSFDGFVGENFEGTILRIRPRSEVRDGKNVFVAEVEVQNFDFRLRPGIQGFATITGDKHSIAWNTFHKAWESLWRTDPTAILADSDSIGNANSSLVARSRQSRPQRSDAAQLANRTDSDLKQDVPPEDKRPPATRMAEAPDAQLRIQ